VGKDIGTARLVSSGAGAAALACLDLLISLGLRRENILVVDSQGVLYSRPQGAHGSEQGAFVRETPARTLADAVAGGRHLPWGCRRRGC